MKTGQIFWGVLLVTIGGLILLNRYDIVEVDWYFVWDLWPVLLILWGLLIVSKDTFAKPVITILIGFFVGAVIYGTIANVITNDDYETYWHDEYEVRKFSEEYDPTIEFAELKLSGGVGTFAINDRTSKLVRGYAKGDVEHLDFRTHFSDNKAYIDVELDNNKWQVFKGSTKKLVEVELNRNPVWEIVLNLGAAKSDFDLSSFRVKKLEINTGATATKIKIGDKYPETGIKIQMGAAALELDIPEDSGCRLKGDMALMTKDFEDFYEENGYYKTSNYETAENKIDINISGGVSSLEINRY